MKSHMARFDDVQVGDRVYYVEDTLWGNRAGYVPVFHVKHADGLVELELRQNGRLVARILHSADVEIRILDKEQHHETQATWSEPDSVNTEQRAGNIFQLRNSSRRAA